MVCTCPTVVHLPMLKSLLHFFSFSNSLFENQHSPVCCHHRATATGVGSRPMLCSRISAVVFSVCAAPVCTVAGTTEEAVFCIHEWLRMSSRDGRSAGLKDKHHLISCWHSEGEEGGRLVLKNHRKTKLTGDRG